ncbi:MAG: PEP-CTERM sorting domain-containing protein [Pyrinomonadaceae bacterium]
MYRKLTEGILMVGLLLCFVCGSAPTANAEKERRQEIASKKPCRDYDRNSSTDEERTSGECNGTVPTPEPISIILFTAGLAGVGFAARRRLRRSE